MACRLRAVVWGLAGVSLLTCLLSFRWFSTSHQIERTALPSTLPDSLGFLQPPGVSKEMRWRREAVGAACEVPEGEEERRAAEGAEILAHQPKKLINLLVDDKNRVLYCYVPKVACTNWKRMMLILSGASNKTRPQDIPADSVHRKNVFTKLSDLEPAGIKHRLQTYSKFLFVRHPVERVVSAFRNKFEKNYTSSAYFKKRFGVRIMKKYRTGGGGGQTSTVPPSGHGVRFPEFVSYLIDTEQESFNEHWAVVSSLCHPCLVNYDYIGKYETLADDSQYILDQIGAPPSLHFPEVLPSKTSGVVDQYFDSLSPQQQKKLINIYRDDFQVFDYHFRDFI